MSLSAATVDFGTEVSGNSAGGRNLADTLDDAWRASVLAANPGVTIQALDLFTGISTTTPFVGTSSFTLDQRAYTIQTEFGSMFGNAGTSTDLNTFTSASSGAITVGSSNILQANAPTPASLTGFARVSTNYDTATTGTGRNRSAIKFDFTLSPTEVRIFGLFLGDFESATQGTVGRLLLYSPTGTLIQDLDLAYAGNVIGTTPATYNEATDSTSSNPPGFYGNETTTWLGVQSIVPIGYAIIVNGDDDLGGNGFSENLGAVGFTLAAVPEASRALFACLASLVLLMQRRRA